MELNLTQHTSTEQTSTIINQRESGNDYHICIKVCVVAIDHLLMNNAMERAPGSCTLYVRVTDAYLRSRGFIKRYYLKKNSAIETLNASLFI